ncbi:hypothetical protein, partial [Listeria monocytogenes]|uniref:hypothetical protein n=1 Tax=Listeria monocytogenes TaxID=1639 RepID=UPI001F08C9C6
AASDVYMSEASYSGTTIDVVTEDDRNEEKTKDVEAEAVMHNATLKMVHVATRSININILMVTPVGTSLHIDNVIVMPSEE